MATKKKASAKKASSSKQKNDSSAKRDTCFIIMPFGEWSDYYYETIYISAIESTGLIPRRADDLYRPSAIVHDIWALTQQAKIILADLTGKNPNVFYELGLAHAVAKPAILVTESMEDVPFDLRALRVITYNKNEPDWGDRLRDKIKTAIKEVLDTPLEAVLPTFIKVKESKSQPIVTKAEKELISMRQDIDLLKRELQDRSTVASRYEDRNAEIRNAKLIAKNALESGSSVRLIQEYLIARYRFPPSQVRAIIKDAQRQLVREKSQPPASHSENEGEGEDEES
ncbi:MAG: hypothetical protein M3362_20440 [Acidobacteriota bacterium]|nr:hypothetical protein [Acidobacteriota bacterium]